MRVAFATDGIFPHALGGMQRHTALLAAALVDAGVDVDVVAPRGHEEDPQPFGVVPVDWPGGGLYPLTLRHWGRRVAAAIAERTYDVVYCQGLSLWDERPGPPVVFNPHGLEFCTVPERTARLKAWPLRAAARRQARHAVRTISLGGHLTDVIASCLDVPRKRIAVVPNGVDPAYFATSGGERDPNLVLFVGRLFENKGLDVLCEAALALPRDTRVLIVGDGPLRHTLLRGYDDPRVALSGPVSEDELRRLYARAAVVALPTRSDGMPTVILEAFCAETPVVATDVGAIRELVDTTTGELLPRADAGLLAQALRRMLGLTATERAQLGAAARRRVEERFSWPVVAARTKALLQEVVAG